MLLSGLLPTPFALPAQLTLQCHSAVYLAVIVARHSWRFRLNSSGWIWVLQFAAFSTVEPGSDVIDVSRTCGTAPRARARPVQTASPRAGGIWTGIGDAENIFDARMRTVRRLHGRHSLLRAFHLPRCSNSSLTFFCHGRFNRASPGFGSFLNAAHGRCGQFSFIRPSGQHYRSHSLLYRCLTFVRLMLTPLRLRGAILRVKYAWTVGDVILWILTTHGLWEQLFTVCLCFFVVHAI